jgi:outer membrane lipoprotein-sorting protein
MFLVFLASCSGVVAASDHPLPVDPDKLLSDVKARAETIDTLVAQFKQTRISNLLQAPLVSTGLIYFERGGNMLTQVNTPSALQLFVRGQDVMILNPELGTVRKRRVPRSDQMIKAWLEGDVSIDMLTQQYELQATRSLNREGYNLQMIPRDPRIARHVDRVEIELNPATLLPEQVMVRLTKGDRTTVELQYVSINKPLPAGIFDIAIPDMFPDNR